jgi:hypothetical protein
MQKGREQRPFFDLAGHFAPISMATCASLTPDGVNRIPRVSLGL